MKENIAELEENYEELKSSSQAQIQEMEEKFETETVELNTKHNTEVNELKEEHNKVRISILFCCLKFCSVLKENFDEFTSRFVQIF